jgi:hypothetical protein
MAISATFAIAERDKEIRSIRRTVDECNVALHTTGPAHPNRKAVYDQRNLALQRIAALERLSQDELIERYTRPTAEQQLAERRRQENVHGDRTLADGLQAQRQRDIEKRAAVSVARQRVIRLKLDMANALGLADSSSERAELLDGYNAEIAAAEAEAARLATQP